MQDIRDDPILGPLYAYWRRQRGARAMPRRADIMPGEIPRLLPHIQIVDRVDGRYRYRLSGTAINEAYGREHSGKFLDAVLTPDRLRLAIETYDQLYAAKRPLVARSVLLTRDDRRVVALRLMLPLSDDGTTVNKVFVGVHLSRDWQAGEDLLAPDSRLVAEQELLVEEIADLPEAAN